MSANKIQVDLTGVPETLLWVLYWRAEESKRADALLSDPKAVTLCESIDYPFAAKFGRPHPVLSLRARCFDDEIRRFLATHPDGTVVSLGEGLETQFWRVDNGRVRWLSVDLPETIDLRRRLLPDDDRRRSIACSALDECWMDKVDQSKGLFITALGLFMYLPGDEVLSLISRCAERFPGAAMMFDAMPQWLTASAPGGTWLTTLLMRGRESEEQRYEVPPMVWGISNDELRARLLADPNITAVRGIRLPAGRGMVFRYLNPLFGSWPLIRSARPFQLLISFRSAADRLEF
ncbi:class I SAM-dependent methyltransferase [Nocardia sp. NPDC101769]|uniref:class I SAM-dependent methyltransferase n=1 Tax=Nocardia sp. NPDC101769 TaxID=3364333 RepID=UPI0038213364